jgi:nicotinamidase-related amidase
MRVRRDPPSAGLAGLERRATGAPADRLAPAVAAGGARRAPMAAAMARSRESKTPGRAGRIATPALPASRTVLLLVDFINPLDFPGAEALRESAVAAAHAALQLRRRLSREGCATVYANDNYGLWRADFGQVQRHCMAAGRDAATLARVLRPRRRDFTILKPRHSAFYATPLHLLLQQMDCRRIVLAGIAADSCVLFTAMDAYLRGYELQIAADGVAAESPELRDRAIEHMSQVLKAEVITAARSAGPAPPRRRS